MPVSQSTTPWYVVHAKPRREFLAATLLELRHGLTVYLPQVSQRLRGTVQPGPLFPGYLFVQADLDQARPSIINATPGVIRLVTFAGQAATVQPDVIEAMRQKVEHLNHHGGLPRHPFQSGDQVRLKSGPLQGLHAVFAGPTRPSERVRVLLEFLGSTQEAEVDVDALEPVASKPKRPRRTRGRGRRINNHNRSTP